MGYIAPGPPGSARPAQPMSRLRNAMIEIGVVLVVLIVALSVAAIAWALTF